MPANNASGSRVWQVRNICKSHHTTLHTCSFCEARFAGLSPWFAPVRRVGGGVGGGLHFGLVRRALFIFAPRSTPNKLNLTAVTLFSQVSGRVAAWPLAVAAGERQHQFLTV
jgi:hypothetical protein